MFEIHVDLNSMTSDQRVFASRRRLPANVSPRVGATVMIVDDADGSRYYATVEEVLDRRLTLIVDIDSTMLSPRSLGALVTPRGQYRSETDSVTPNLSGHPSRSPRGRGATSRYTSTV